MPIMSRGRCRTGSAMAAGADKVCLARQIAPKPKQKQKRKQQNRICWIEHLPEDILNKIMGMKHQLEFRDTVKDINLFRVVANHEVIDTRMPIRRLLDVASDRKIVDISLFHFRETPQDTLQYNADKVKEEYGLSKIKIAYHFMGAFVDIRFKERETLRNIDYINLIYHLGVVRNNTHTLVDVESDTSVSKNPVISFDVKAKL